MLKRISGLGDIGVIADAMDGEIPENALSDALNFRFGGGFTERFSGSIGVYGTPSVAPYGLCFYSSSLPYWIYAGLAKIYAVTGTTHTNVTRQTASVDVDYTATNNNVWTMGVLGGIAIANDGTDDPQYWAGNTANNFAAVTAWPANTKCKSMRVFKNYLIALNITKAAVIYPHMVKWSHSADPGAMPDSWDETNPAKDAGENDLSDSQSVIVDGCTLGDNFIIYKERAYYFMEYIGAPFIFRFKKIYDGVGILARNCVAEIPLGHAVFGQGDIYVHNGGKPESIITDIVRNKIFTQLDSVNYGLSFVVTNYKKNEVWFCYPTIGATVCTRALVWNYVQKTTTFRELQNFTCGATGAIESTVSSAWSADPDKWTEDSTTWDQTDTTAGEQRCIFGANDSILHLVDQQTKFNGTTITGYIERTGLSFGDPSAMKLVRGMRIHADGADGEAVTVRIGAAKSESGGVSWGSNINYLIGQNDLACTSVAGRFIAYRITSTVPIKLRTIDIEYSMKSVY